MNSEELDLAQKDLIEKMRLQIRRELSLLQTKILGEGDVVILSALGIDGFKKLGEILVEESQRNLDNLEK